MVPIFSTLYNSFLVRVYMSSCGAPKLLVYIYLCFLYYFYYYLVLTWLTSLTAVLCVWLFSEAKILKIMDKSLGTLLHLWGFFLNLDMPNPSPHTTNNVVCMFPDFFSGFQHHVEWGRENCKKILKRKHCFMRSPRNHRKLWKLYYRIPRFFVLAPVVQKLDSTIHWINYYPLDSAIHLLNNWGQYWRYTVHCINNTQNI